MGRSCAARGQAVPEVPHLCRAAATSSCARGRTRECGCLAVGAEVVARSAHACDHTDVTQTPILAFQILAPPEVPRLCRAAVTSSCARGRTRECGCLAFAAKVVARSAYAFDHTDVTQTLRLAFRIWGSSQGSTFVPRGCHKQLRACAHTRVWMSSIWR